MKPRAIHRCSLYCLGLLLVLAAPVGHAAGDQSATSILLQDSPDEVQDEPPEAEAPSPEAGVGDIRPPTPMPPPAPTPTATAPSGPPEADLTVRTEEAAPAAPEVTGLLERTPQVRTVAVRQRSPLAQEPVIRGFQYGQIYSQVDGAWALPVRPDLDSRLSKIDPSLVEEAAVIPGPYGLRYGPGFAYFSIRTLPTPRYDYGFELHPRLGLTYRGNGQQLLGNATLSGGTSNGGFIVSYGNRSGSDYRSGNGTRIPSSFHDESFLGQVGVDLTPDTTLEVRYRRAAQRDVETAAQLFDIRALTSDAVSLSLVDESPLARWLRFRADAWYNRTNFNGDTLSPSKVSFHVVDRIELALDAALGYPVNFDGLTHGDVMTSGLRFATTYGEDDWVNWTFGADMRYAEQAIEEQFAIVPTTATGSSMFPSTNLPRSWQWNPGLFAEVSIPWLPYLRTSLGTRYDAVRSEVRSEDVRESSSLGPAADLQKTDNLFGCYLTNELEINAAWKARVSLGRAERPPTLIERYADGLFLGIIQSGFSRVIGNPTLNKEQLWQIDVALEWERERVRSQGRWFYAWIEDYATYEANLISLPSDARLLSSINSDRATLTGFEWFGELDMADMLTAFGGLSYVRGQDEAIDQPLPGIPPLEGRAGLRFHEPRQNPRWNLDFGARMVAGQDRTARLRRVSVPGTESLETPTPGFTVFYIRGNYRPNNNLRITGGVENLFDRNYLEHLNLRYQADDYNGTTIPATAVFAPGITPYLALEWSR